MRIAMLTNNYKPIVGGVPVSIERLSAALRRRGHEVTIFAPHFEGAEPEEGIVRFRSRKLPTGHGMVMPDPSDQIVEQRFTETHFDMVHVHHPIMAGKSGLRLAQKHGIPVAFTYHTRYERYLHYLKPYELLQKLCGREIGWIQKLVAAHNHRFMSACDLIFAPTPLIRDHLREQEIQTPVKVLPTGLGDESFDWDEDLTRTIKQRYKQGKRYLFCSVSRLAKEKNISFLIQALVCFKQMYGDCFQMLMIGDGPYRRKLEQEAHALGLQNNIAFTGNVPHGELSSYYRACDLFLFASQSETQGLVLQEAMAAALPVIAVKASGVCDIVQNGENGFMTILDQSALAHAVGNALCNRHQYAALRAGAYATAMNCMDSHMAATAESVYMQMIDEKCAAGARYGQIKNRGNMPIQDY